MAKATGNKAQRVIKQTFLDKKEALIRQGELDMRIISNVLGLTPGGDMKDFMRETTAAVKKIKKV